MLASQVDWIPSELTAATTPSEAPNAAPTTVAWERAELVKRIMVLRDGGRAGGREDEGGRE